MSEHCSDLRDSQPIPPTQQVTTLDCHRAGGTAPGLESGDLDSWLFCSEVIAFTVRLGMGHQGLKCIGEEMDTIQLVWFRPGLAQDQLAYGFGNFRRRQSSVSPPRKLLVGIQQGFRQEEQSNRGSPCGLKEGQRGSYHLGRNLVWHNCGVSLHAVFSPVCPYSPPWS